MSAAGRGAQELQCKGIMLRNRLELVGRLFGPEAIDRTLAELAPDVGSPLRYGAIAAASFYPLSWLRALHAAAARALHAGPELARRLGHDGAVRNFTSVHRVLLAVSSPRAIIERSDRVLRTYFDGGKIEIVGLAPNRAVSRWSGCAGFDRNVWESMLGGAAAALELSRAKDVRVRFRAGAGDGDPEAEMLAFWQ